MELPKYQISTKEDQTVFKFVSDGPNGKITKIVLYQPMNEPDLYNLALGDLDSKTREIDFEIHGKLKNELLRFKKGVNFDAFIIQLKNK